MTVDLPLVARGKVREVYDAGADRLLLVASRPDLRLRPRAAHADPGQGPGAHRAVGVVVRAAGAGAGAFGARTT